MSKSKNVRTRKSLMCQRERERFRFWDQHPTTNNDDEGYLEDSEQSQYLRAKSIRHFGASQPNARLRQYQQDVLSQ